MKCDTCGGYIRWSDLRNAFICPDGHNHGNGGGAHV